MANIKFTIDPKELSKGLKETSKQLNDDLTKAAGTLANMVNTKIRELAGEKLKSLSKTYTDNLTFTNPEEGLWVITLKNPAMWIEEGRKSGSMIEDLLRNNANVSKEGNRYKAIPFNYSKPSSEQSPKTQTLTNQIKNELNARGVSLHKIETDASGSPRIGKLHTLNIDSARPTPKSKSPALFGVNVYQTKTEGGGVRRDVVSFRVVSDKQIGTGAWQHPGRKADKLMDQAFEQCLAIWEREILSTILAKYE